MVFIKQNLDNMKLKITLDDKSSYFLNDKTMNNLMKNKIEDNHLPDGNRKDNEYQEVVNLSAKTKYFILSRVEAETNKTKPGGGFSSTLITQNSI